MVLVLVPPMTVSVAGRIVRYPKRFAEVVPDALYRGGRPTARHIRNLKEMKSIRTIVTLEGYEDRPETREEIATAKETGIKLLRFGMPGDGCGSFAAMDAAADALAEKANWPLFFHCAAGKQRSNATLAAYRLKHCGWTIDQVLSELDEYDLYRVEEAELCDHLRTYAEHVARVRSYPKRRSRFMKEDGSSASPATTDAILSNEP